jgi:hypothetical protein
MTTFGTSVARPDRASVFERIATVSGRLWLSVQQTRWYDFHPWRPVVAWYVDRLQALAPWPQRAWRLQPLPVVAHPLYPAARPHCPRGHVRI